MALLSDLLPSAGGGDLVAQRLTEKQTASGGQTVVTLSTLTYRKGYQDLTVAINGVTQVPDGHAYTENTTNKVTFSEPLVAGDVLTFSIVRLVAE